MIIIKNHVESNGANQNHLFYLVGELFLYFIKSRGITQRNHYQIQWNNTETTATPKPPSCYDNLITITTSLINSVCPPPSSPPSTHSPSTSASPVLLLHPIFLGAHLPVVVVFHLTQGNLWISCLHLLLCVPFQHPSSASKSFASFSLLLHRKASSPSLTAASSSTPLPRRTSPLLPPPHLVTSARPFP